ncbi:MAG: tRNA-uridine aminocarboxypropyltransferase [Bacillota bacterium]
MDLQTYKERRDKLSQQAPKYRELCLKCIQPKFSCYCSHVQAFDPAVDFVVLIHPIEAKRRIATGRMSHLVLQKSFLICGQDYSADVQVNQILNDPQRFCVMLYPGRQSQNLTYLTEAERSELFPSDKRLTIFVIDGTWATAIKTVRQSQNLQALPRICFTPDKVSNFRVRKQPQDFCYSTIEAIHQTIELIGRSQGFDVDSRIHDRLLHVFDRMVETQIECASRGEQKPDYLRYSRDRKRANIFR